MLQPTRVILALHSLGKTEFEPRVVTKSEALPQNKTKTGWNQFQRLCCPLLSSANTRHSQGGQTHVANI